MITIFIISTLRVEAEIFPQRPPSNGHKTPHSFMTLYLNINVGIHLMFDIYLDRAARFEPY